MAFALLLPEIMLMLPPLLGTQDICNLTLTCKHFRSVLLSHLYKKIWWRECPCIDKHQNTLPLPPIHLLLRSLMKSPDLGEYVQEIDFSIVPMENIPSDGTITLWAYDAVPGLSSCEIDCAIQWMQHYHPIRYKSFERLLKRGRFDAYVCLILAFLPNLRSLKLCVDYIPFRSELLGSIVKHSSVPLQQGAILTNTLPRYRSLQKIELAASSRFVFARNKPLVEDIYCFFNLPELQYLQICLPQTSNFWPDLTDGTRMQNLTTLLLPVCEANESALEALLSRKPPLRKLEYHYRFGDFLLFDESYHIDLAILSRALIYVQETLENLTLSIHHDNPDAENIPYRTRRHGLFQSKLSSLTAFPRLEYLQIPFLVLTGWKAPANFVNPLADMLPSSISYLCLTDDLCHWRNRQSHLERCFHQLEDLLAAKERGNAAEKLEIVEMQSRSPWYGWETEDEKEFKRLGVRYGIETRYA